VLFYFSKSLATNTSSSAGSAVPISLFLIGFLGLICERQTSDIHRFFLYDIQNACARCDGGFGAMARYAVCLGFERNEIELVSSLY
jgi:hypothetical protein